MHAGVVTPEAVLLELPTAGVATRALARAVDLAVQGLLFGLLMMLAAFASPRGVSFIVVLMASAFLVVLVWPIGMEVLWRGRSLGKFFFGLRVVGVDGAPEAPRQAVVRGLVALVDLYASLGFLAAVSALGSPSAQRPGDLAAGTVVIRDPRNEVASTPIAFHPPPGYEAYVATLDVGALDDEDFSLVREFLLRVREMDPAARAALAAELATAVLARTGTVAPPGVDAETWLVCVASAYQLRQGGLLADARAGLAPLAPMLQPPPVSTKRRRRR